MIMESQHYNRATSYYTKLQHAPAVYFIQPPPGLEEAPFLPTMVEFPSQVTSCAVPPLDAALAVLAPMPLPLPPCPTQIASLDLPVAPMSPTLATYRFPPMPTSLLPQSSKHASSRPGDKLPPLGQKSLLLPPMPSILAPRRSSAGIAGQMLPAKGVNKSGKKKAKHACKLCCISFTRAHDLKRHNTIHKTDKAFPCPLCSKRFGRRDALKRHLEVRGPNHDDFSKKASAGKPRKSRAMYASQDASEYTGSPESGSVDQTRTWDDCGSSGIYVSSGDPSTVSSPLLEVPGEFDWPSGLPSAPATHLDYGQLIGGTQFWDELLS